MAKSNSKRTKTKAPKKAAPTGMVSKTTSSATQAKGSSFMANKGLSSQKKGNSVSTPRKAGGS